MTELHDMHCHLDFMANGEEVAHEAARAGSMLFANTVTPAGYEAAAERFGAMPNVAVGLGLHPWWVRAGDAAGSAGGAGDSAAVASGGMADGGACDDARRLVELLGRTRFIGEVGLDFGRRHAGTREAQLAAFSQVVRACGEAGGKVMSLHSVGATRETLDVLTASGALASCTCIFHWYTGPSDQLKRAIDAGCCFSVNSRMLATRRGPEYVKAIPASRLLLETDAPPAENEPYSWEALHDELRMTADAVAKIKGQDVLDVMADNAQRIMEAPR